MTEVTAAVRFPILFVARTVIYRFGLPDSRQVVLHQLNFQLTRFEFLCKVISSQCQRIVFFICKQQKQRSVIVFVSLSLFSFVLFFLSSLSFPLTLCFALRCHLSSLRLLLCVSCQVLDIIYDLVLCPDCETPDKTSISATNTKYVDSLLHSPLSHCVP